MRTSLGGAVFWAASVFVPAVSWGEADWGRNPFVFGEKTATSAEKTGEVKPKSDGLAVEMTLAQGDTRLAVVNGRKVKIGDSVGGAVVSAITIENVTFIKNGKTMTRMVGEMDEAR